MARWMQWHPAVNCALNSQSEGSPLSMMLIRGNPMLFRSFNGFVGSLALTLALAAVPGCGGDGGESSTSQGQAQCGAGAQLCGNACTITALDPQNCGQCGMVCGAGESCDSGSCVVQCSGGTTSCDGSCIDTQNDPKHCGGCATACAEGDLCSAGACVAVCGASGLVQCGDACVDTQSDVKNCGKCGTACPGAADACIQGACITPTPPPAVYTMTNDAAGNKILSFPRAADGSLSAAGEFTSTGGLGTSGGLGNQNGLIYSQEKNMFFAVNAGDNTVSMLSLELDGSLKLLAHVPSGGDRPVSVTASGDIVYVVNAGTAMMSAGNISGFKIEGENLNPIQGAMKPLSAANPGPAQIQFTPDGKVLVVTEKATNMIVTYPVNNGVAGNPVQNASAGQTPFGFAFGPGQHLIVSDAAGGMANMTTTSSYAIDAAGMLTPVSPAVPTTRTAACWVAVHDAYAYVANAGTNDITGFSVANDGVLTMLNADGITGQTKMGATDEDVSDDGKFLYVVSNGAHVFSIFGINGDGSLTKMPDSPPIPTGVNGLVAR